MGAVERGGCPAPAVQLPACATLSLSRGLALLTDLEKCSFLVFLSPGTWRYTPGKEMKTDV